MKIIAMLMAFGSLTAGALAVVGTGALMERATEVVDRAH